jgi:hypothetical protein
MELSDRLEGMVHAQGITSDGEFLLMFAPGQNRAALPPGSGNLFRVVREDGKENIPVPPVEIHLVSFEGAEVTIEPGAARAGSILPKQLVLRQNVPNPFNPSTTITFSVPERNEGPDGTQIRLEVFNIRGSRIAVLADGYFPAGVHRVHWKGIDYAGRNLASGVYFYRLQASGRVMTRKMILLK